jgi:hypothetical protein
MTLDEIIEVGATWTQAISEASFCGEPSRYEDAYERLLQETNKLESVHSDECDWKVVRDSADELTRTKTKDMTVLGALCVGELRQNGPERFAAALWAYRELLATHRDDMLPNKARRRGRAGALTWLMNQVELFIPTLQPQMRCYDGYKLAHDQLNELETIMRPELESDFPSIKRIREALDQLVQATIPPDEPEPETPETQQAEQQPDGFESFSNDAAESSKAPAGAMLDKVRSDKDADAALRAVVLTLKKTADYFINKSTASPVGFNLAHIAAQLGGTEIWERPQPIDELIADAKRIGSETGLQEGCSLLQEALKSAGTPVSRFRLRLAMAQICIDASAPDLAKPILRDLLEETKKPVSEWLLDLTVDLAATLIQCANALEGSGGPPDQRFNQEVKDMGELLAKLSPGRAFQVK